ncbi:MAG: hypothetical protein WBX20_13955 [Terrimicrobiaceae bacterium]
MWCADTVEIGNLRGSMRIEQKNAADFLDGLPVLVRAVTLRAR